MFVKSVCRICAALCGTVLELDDNKRIKNISPDRGHALSRGYACAKGLYAHEAMYSPERILHPLKRMPDGSFAQISLEQALDEISIRLRQLIDEDGARSVGIYTGTQVFFNVAFNAMVRAWLQAIGSPCYFTSYTIDQSAKSVAAGRMGTWNAGRQHMFDADVAMLIGANPLVSRSVIGFPNQNPAKVLKAQKSRGMKLIVLDPRVSETARLADVHLQVKAGEDATLLAGMVRMVLANGWEDREFCARYVTALETLRAAVEPFTPEYVEARAGISPQQLERAVRLFAVESRKGMTSTGTGANMGPRSNLSQHFAECLNVICGRFPRAGERVRNSGVAAAPRAFRAEVDPPVRWWESSERSNVGGYGALHGEMMASTIPEEILFEGPGRLRALFVAGGNLAVALPDQRKAVEGLRALDLLVALDPFMSQTARLAHYILPPTMQYEHADLYYDPNWEAALAAVPFQQYIAASSKPPGDSELADEWYFLYALAQRLGIAPQIGGVPLDMSTTPTTDDVLAQLLRQAQVPFADLAGHPEGHVFDVPQLQVEAARPNATGRFDVIPTDVQTEIAQLLQENWRDSQRHFRLIVRRMLEMQNSFGTEALAVRHIKSSNPAYMHPSDLSSLNLASGDTVDIVSNRDRVRAQVEADPGVLPGCVSMSHCRGGLPDEEVDYDERGANTNLLIDIGECRETINAMPRMSAIPVDVVPL